LFREVHRRLRTVGSVLLPQLLPFLRGLRHDLRGVVHVAVVAFVDCFHGRRRRGGLPPPRPPRPPPTAAACSILLGSPLSFVFMAGAVVVGCAALAAPGGCNRAAASVNASTIIEK